MVTATSAGPGLGSTFTVRLPAGAGPADGPIDGSLAAVAAAPARILLVDDNVDLTRSLAELLRLSGHVVEAAYNGPDGLAVARGFRPDLVLLDIALPGMDGYEVLPRLREDPATRQARIIAVTGYGHEDERRRCSTRASTATCPSPSTRPC